MPYRLTRRAEADLIKIYQYTAHEWGFVQADLYAGGLDSVMNLLTEFPKMGKKIKGNRYRFPHEKHIILYQHQDDMIVVNRIWDARRQTLPKGWRGGE